MNRNHILASRAKSVLSVGYVVLDVLIHEDGIGHSAGGTSGNVAANLSYFGWAASVAALYGDDPAGTYLRADLEYAGVSTRALIQRTDMTTPVVIHEVKNGIHRFRFGCPVCGRRFSRFRAIPKAFADRITAEEVPDVLFVDRVSSAAVLLATAVRQSGGLVFFEPSRPSESRYFRELLQLSHIVKFSADRMDPTSELLNGATPLQIYTHGANGAYWRRNNGSWEHVNGYSTSVLDAGGAGDWTTAALLAKLPSLDPGAVLDIDLSGPLAYAQAVAALSCQVLGARGLSYEFTLEELKARVDLLQGEVLRTQPSRSQRLIRSPWEAACSACLSRHG